MLQILLLNEFHLEVEMMLSAFLVLFPVALKDFLCQTLSLGRTLKFGLWTVCKTPSYMAGGH